MMYDMFKLKFEKVYFAKEIFKLNFKTKLRQNSIYNWF